MAEEEQTTQEDLKGDDLLRAVEEPYLRDDIPEFRVGDTVDVEVIIEDGEKQRTQTFRGTCIARKGSGVDEMFTVRKMVQGEGVERIFPLHSPNIKEIRRVRRGKARRAKLHFLRERKGKDTRVEEDFRARQEDAGAAGEQAAE
ncbi:MAG: 50S ribosomal protein L19 [Planctomycetota bacterium]